MYEGQSATEGRIYEELAKTLLKLGEPRVLSPSAIDGNITVVENRPVFVITVEKPSRQPEVILMGITIPPRPISFRQEDCSSGVGPFLKLVNGA